jgi:VWFA-related protein
MKPVGKSLRSQLALAMLIAIGGYAVPAGAQTHIWQMRQDRRASLRENCAQIDPKSGPRNQPGYKEIAITVHPSKAGDTSLSSKDLRLYDGNRELPIQFFRQEPVSIGLVVDTSTSMSAKLSQVQSALREFVQNLNPADEVFLAAFANRSFMLQEPTTRHETLGQRISILHAYGQTAFYDAILVGLKVVAMECYRRKALLVITDGMDNASQASLNDVVRQVHAQQVPIYSVGIGDPNVPAASGVTVILGPLAPGAIAENGRVDARALQTLARDTNAITFIVPEVGDGASLRKAVNLVNQRLGNEYTAGFMQPPNQPPAHLRLEAGPGKNITAKVVGGASVPVNSSPAI